jgi:hypothetical protein
MSARIAAVIGAFSTVLLVPAAAHAVPVLQPLKPCYVTAATSAGQQSEGVAISATGFTPNSTVTLAIDGQPVSTNVGVDAAGNLTLDPQNVPAPFSASGSREFTVTLTENGNPANTVSATSSSTSLGVTLKPRRARPSKRIRFRGLGFTGKGPVYAHYVYKGKVRKTVRMARRKSPCGRWEARRPQIPVDDPKTGTWTVQFDQSKRYRNAQDPNSGLRSVFVLIRISVTLVPGN